MELLPIVHELFFFLSEALKELMKEYYFLIGTKDGFPLQ